MARFGPSAVPSHQDIEALYRRYAPALHRVCRRFVRDREEIDDLVQESFARYLRRRGRWRNDAAPFTILYRIATNAAIDRLRRTATEDRRNAELQNEASTGRSGHRIEHALDLALLTHGLADDDVTVAVLYHLDGYTQDEIASAQDLSRRTVGKMLKRVENHVRKRAARLGYDDAAERRAAVGQVVER